MVAQRPLDTMLARYGLDRQTVSTALGITREAVRKWAVGTGRPSVVTAMRAEQLLNLPRHELRPDVWAPQGLSSPANEIDPAPVSPTQPAPAPRRRPSPGRPAGRLPTG